MTTNTRCYYFDNGTVHNRVTVHPKQAADGVEYPPIVFAPNWNAEARHWCKFVQQLSRFTEVYYFESREKAGTRYTTDRVDYSVSAMGRDLAGFLNQFERPYFLVTVSLNTVALFKGWRELRHKPLAQVLVCPVIRLQLPWYCHLFPLVSENLVTTFRPLVFRMLQLSPRTNKLAGNLQAAFRDENLRDILRLKASVEALRRIRTDLRQEVSPIRLPSFILATEQDRIHRKQDAVRVAQATNADDFQVVRGFKSTQQPETAERILRWLQSRHAVSRNPIRLVHRLKEATLKS